MKTVDQALNDGVVSALGNLQMAVIQLQAQVQTLTAENEALKAALAKAPEGTA